MGHLVFMPLQPQPKSNTPASLSNALQQQIIGSMLNTVKKQHLLYTNAASGMQHPRPAPTSKECKSCPERTSHRCATWSAVTVTTVCPCGAILPLISCCRCCSTARHRPDRISHTRAVLSKATVSSRRPAPSRHPMLMLSSCPASSHTHQSCSDSKTPSLLWQ